METHKLYICNKSVKQQAASIPVSLVDFGLLVHCWLDFLTLPSASGELEKPSLLQQLRQTRTHPPKRSHLLQTYLLLLRI